MQKEKAPSRNIRSLFVGLNIWNPIASETTVAKLPFSEVKKILAPVVYQTGGLKPTDTPGQTIPRQGVQTPRSVIQAAVAENNLHVTKQPKKNVIIITPFMVEDPSLAEKMKRYGKRALRDSILKNEAPLASHIFYYSVLNQKDPIERDIGLHAQLSWLRVSDIVAIYVDFGITPAMKVALNNAVLLQKRIEYRSIGALA